MSRIQRWSVSPMPGPPTIRSSARPRDERSGAPPVESCTRNLLWASTGSVRNSRGDVNVSTNDACGFRSEAPHGPIRSEEHTSELQSRGHLVCRLLLEEKNARNTIIFVCNGSKSLQLNAT